MKMNAPFLSVIVPVYNVENYVSACVRSLIEQTFRDFEIILVDDGSTDNSSAICDAFAKRYAFIRTLHQSNGGLSAARNTGIDNARGEWVTFVDSDDAVAPNMLEALCSLAQRYHTEIASITYQSRRGPSEQVYTSEEALLHLLKDDTSLNTSAWGKLYHRSLFEGIRFPVGLIFEDFATVPLLFDRANAIAHSNEALYFYREDNTGSIMHSSFSPKRLQYFEVSDGVEAFFTEKYPKLLKHVRDRRTRYAIAFYRQAVQAKAVGAQSKVFLRKQVRRGILFYLFSGYKAASKLYGLLIAVCPPLADRIF